MSNDNVNDNVRAILDEIRAFKREAKEFATSDYRTGYLSALSALEGFIAGLPAVDAAPVVHGRWMLKTRWDTDGALIVTAECSEGCENEREIWRGYFIGVPDYIAEHTALSNAKMAHLSNYCPNCGAKMDGDS